MMILMPAPPVRYLLKVFKQTLPYLPDDSHSAFVKGFKHLVELETSFNC